MPISEPTPKQGWHVPMQDYPKRLIEVDFFIARISAHARREKSIRHGRILAVRVCYQGNTSVVRPQ